MKIERNISLIRSFVNVFLALSIALNGALIVLLSEKSDSSLLPQAEFQIILSSILFLFVVLISINYLLNTLYRKPVHDKHWCDDLTGFMTRQEFSRVFEHSVFESSRSGDPLCLLLIDIDHFRRVNEKHGQQTGDEILTLLSRSIQSVLRTSDINCRWAGDQFLVALKDCAIKDACRIAAKLLVTVRQQELVIGKKTIKVTTSIGVAQMIRDDTVKHLIARVETGLHSACDNGRNTYAIGYDWILLEYYSKPIF